MSWWRYNHAPTRAGHRGFNMAEQQIFFFHLFIKQETQVYVKPHTHHRLVVWLCCITPLISLKLVVWWPLLPTSRPQWALLLVLRHLSQPFQAGGRIPWGCLECVALLNCGSTLRPFLPLLVMHWLLPVQGLSGQVFACNSGDVGSVTHKGVLDRQATDHVSQRSEHGLATEQQQQQRSLRFLSCTQREWESLGGDSILGTLQALLGELFSIPAAASFLRGDLPLWLHSLSGGLLLEPFRLEAPQPLMRLVSCLSC